MTGTLRAALVPYEQGNPSYSAAVDLLDEYAESYPTEGSLEARVGGGRGGGESVSFGVCVPMSCIAVVV